MVIQKLSRSCAIKDNPKDRDAEARVIAVKKLVLVWETLTSTTECSDIQLNEYTSLFTTIKTEVMQSLLNALEDYSVDNRGDAGLWVRTAAMNGLVKCTYILCKNINQLEVNQFLMLILQPI